VFFNNIVTLIKFCTFFGLNCNNLVIKHGMENMSEHIFFCGIEGNSRRHLQLFPLSVIIRQAFKISCGLEAQQVVKRKKGIYKTTNDLTVR
jgi:hypothetical protein